MLSLELVGLRFGFRFIFFGLLQDLVSLLDGHIVMDDGP